MTPSAPPSAAEAGAGGGRRAAVVAGAAYLACALLLWWHVLPHPGTVTTCGCGDAALTLWVVRWPAWAIAHGANLFHSTRLFVPGGINMVPNSLALGVATAPITWLAGPVASLNVIDVLAPALSALAMYWLLRRWTTWAPSAFVGGLFFGFCPFVLTSLALAHPNFGLLAPVPLLIGALDDLVTGRTTRPVRTGVVLGLLVVVEFFVSVEVLALVALLAALAALVALVVAALGHRHPGAVVRRAAPGLAAAAGVAGVLLAVPVWYFLEGPSHLAGRAWPNSPAGTVVNTPADFLHGALSPALTTVMHVFGGYQGPPLPVFALLGPVLVAVVVVGWVVWRHDARLRCFGLVGVVAAALSLGIVSGTWTPWRLFVHVPVLVNVVPVNLTFAVDTCVAVMLAVVVDRTRTALGTRTGDGTAAAVAVTVAALALLPVVATAWPNLPLTVRPVRAPTWFTAAAPHLGSGAVVLPYPAALGGIQSPMAWQAVEGMTFSMVGGGGPGIVPSRAGPERPGFTVLARASLALGPAPVPSAATVVAVRRAVAGWGVTTVVVPDQAGLPSYDRGRGVGYAVAFFTATFGTAPRRSVRAWTWSGDALRGRPVVPAPARFAACTAATGGAPAVAACVLGDR